MESIPQTHAQETGAARFVWVEIEGCLWFSNVTSLFVPQWKKSNFVFIEAKTKAIV